VRRQLLTAFKSGIRCCRHPPSTAHNESRETGEIGVLKPGFP